MGMRLPFEVILSYALAQRKSEVRDGKKGKAPQDHRMEDM
jgi:hypothetical protein